MQEHPVLESPPNPIATLDGHEYNYFVGVGYLGFQGHPAIIEAANEAMKKYGMGSGTSRSGYGNNPVLLKVEELVAKFMGTESSLYFVSGYFGNSILLMYLKDQFDYVLMDQNAHYSIQEAGILSQKPILTYQHGDSSDLSRVIKNNVAKNKIPLLITDGVFPITGEIPPLPEYINALEYCDNFLLCVDDAHAFGVVGPNARGSFDHFGITGKQFYSSGTLSKAFGTLGGTIAHSRQFIADLKQKSHFFKGSSPPATPVAGAAVKALEIVMADDFAWIKKLRCNVRFIKKVVLDLGFDIPDNEVPIFCLSSRPDIDYKKLHAQLVNEGYLGYYVPPDHYTGAPPNGGIRFAVFANHSQEQLNRLAELLKRFISK